MYVCTAIHTCYYIWAYSEVRSQDKTLSRVPTHYTEIISLKFDIFWRLWWFRQLWELGLLAWLWLIMAVCSKEKSGCQGRFPCICTNRYINQTFEVNIAKWSRQEECETSWIRTRVQAEQRYVKKGNSIMTSVMSRAGASFFRKCTSMAWAVMTLWLFWFAVENERLKLILTGWMTN